MLHAAACYGVCSRYMKNEMFVCDGCNRKEMLDKSKRQAKLLLGRTKYQRALDANWSQNCSRFQRNKK